MMLVLCEFLLGVVLAIIALYAQYENMPGRGALLDKWNSLPCLARTIILMGLAISPSVIGLVNGCEAAREKMAADADRAKADADRAKADADRAELSAKLDVATNTIEEQRHTIGSIAENTKTTLEGKRRFIRIFHDLSRYTKIGPDGTIFEGLLCDDGVAMYWFRKDTEKMTGFHFFSDKELIRILSGLPNDAIKLSEEGKLHVAPQSQLAIALNDSILKQTPPYTPNPIEQEKALESVIEEMKVILRYVYRAHSPQFMAVGSASPSPCLLDGVAISFKYTIDPFAAEKVEGVVPFPNFMFNGKLLQKLCGIDKATLSSLVIEESRNMGVEPKVRIRDIQSLNRMCERKANLRNSPFDNADTKD